MLGGHCETIANPATVDMVPHHAEGSDLVCAVPPDESRQSELATGGLLHREAKQELGPAVLLPIGSSYKRPSAF